LNHKHHGVERLAICSGEVGLGKTIAGLYFGVRDGAIMIQVWPRMTQHWLLRVIAKELGIEPAWRTERLIDQIMDVCRAAENKKTFIFDEMDHLFRDSDIKKIEALESLRKIHDTCRACMIFIGEEKIDKKFERIPRLYDRVIEKIHFERYVESDVRDVIKQLSDYRFEDDAIQKITKLSDGRIRPVIRLIHKAEGAARVHHLKTIEAKDF
jgi:DNA transposition AAA+ family ATPase